MKRKKEFQIRLQKRKRKNCQIIRLANRFVEIQNTRMENVI